MIIHRAIRDVKRCRLKYGEAWTEYEKLVPYLFIPVCPFSRALPDVPADRKTVYNMKHVALICPNFSVRSRKIVQTFYAA